MTKRTIFQIETDLYVAFQKAASWKEQGSIEMTKACIREARRCVAYLRKHDFEVLKTIIGYTRRMYGNTLEWEIKAALAP